MTRLIKLGLLAVAVALGVAPMGGCNTFQGMGADMQETGNAITQGPHAGYHQDTRQF